MSFRLPLFLSLCLLPLLMPGCGGNTAQGKNKPPGEPRHIVTIAKHRPAPAAPPASNDATAQKTGAQKPYVIGGVTYTPIDSAHGYRERGIASWYGEPFHGRRTANGEIYNMYGDTAAHKTLPMNTVLLVRNLDNDRSTVLRINDRGPFAEERIIDLSYAKAKELGVLDKGTARVEIVALAAKRQPATPEQDVASNARTQNEPPPQTRPQAQASPPDFEHGNFYVQIGAFERVGDARVLAMKFVKLGRDTVIQQYPAAGMDLYRVLVFASHSLREARKYEAEMRASGFKYTLLLAR